MSQDNLEIPAKEVSDSETNESNLEHLQHVANSFTEINERYEQLKKVVHEFAENIDEIKEHVEEMKVELNVKYEAFLDLQSRTEQLLEDVKSGVFIDKETYDATILDLKARTNAAELRISGIKRVVTGDPKDKKKKSLDDEKKGEDDDLALD